MPTKPPIKRQHIKQPRATPPRQHRTLRLTEAALKFYADFAEREGVKGLGPAIERAAKMLRNADVLKGPVQDPPEPPCVADKIQPVITLYPPFSIPSLQSYFGKICIINLDRRTDRMEKCQNEFATMFPDGDLSSGQLHRVSAFAHPASGVYGCARSHRQLWRDIAAGPHARVLILEDDFAAITLDILRTPFLGLPNHETLFPNVQGFKPEQQVWKTFCSILDGHGTANERFAALARFLPEKWDVLYLGGSYGEAPIARWNEHVVRCGSMKTTTAYAITREFAGVITARIDAAMGSDDLERHPGAIDDVLGSFAKDHLFYCLQPRLFYQRPSHSDISGETNNGLFSMTDPVHEGMV